MKTDQEPNVVTGEVMECPECGSEDCAACGPTDVTGIETYYKRCFKCGHTWDVE